MEDFSVLVEFLLLFSGIIFFCLTYQRNLCLFSDVGNGKFGCIVDRAEL